MKDVVLNSWKANLPGGWQTSLLNKLPFKAGEKFEIAIINGVHGFQVRPYFEPSLTYVMQISVDGVYFTTFDHRMCSFDIAEVEVSPLVVDLEMRL